MLRTQLGFLRVENAVLGSEKLKHVSRDVSHAQVGESATLPN